MGVKNKFPTGDYFKVPNLMFGTQKQSGWIDHIGHRGFAVYALILRRYDYEKQQGVYESHASMAKVLGISVPTLEKYLSMLLNCELIERRPAGKRRYAQWQYVPRVPMPDPPARSKEDGNTQTAYVKNTQTDYVKTERLPKMTRNITQIGEVRTIPQDDDSDKVNPSSNPSIRLFNRLNQNMYVENEIKEVMNNIENVPLKTQVQVAWKYWCELWVEHYQRPYFLAKAKENGRVIAKDKKNLRDKIEAVGFAEVITRMRRCIDVCDTIFPCMVKGEWQRPISFNDFINNHFFDQWIVPRMESKGSAPKTQEQKVKAAMDKKKKDGDQTDAHPNRAR
jgi:hypothetical protein